MTNEEFRKARITLGLTQQALADKLGLNIRHIQRLERENLEVMKQTELAIKYLLRNRK